MSILSRSTVRLSILLSSTLGCAYAPQGFAQTAPSKSKIQCQVDYRTLDNNNQVVRKSAPLVITDQYPTIIVHELKDMEGKYFSVNESLDSDSLLVMITTAPNYTSGTALKARLGSDGKLSISEVQGETVYKLQCHLNVAP